MNGFHLFLTSIIAAWFSFITFIVVDQSWRDYGTRSIERGFIILEDDKYRLERVD